MQHGIWRDAVNRNIGALEEQHRRDQSLVDAQAASQDLAGAERQQEGDGEQRNTATPVSAIVPAQTLPPCLGARRISGAAASCTLRRESHIVSDCAELPLGKWLPLQLLLDDALHDGHQRTVAGGIEVAAGIESQREIVL